MPKLPVFFLRDYSSSVYTIREQSESKYFKMMYCYDNCRAILEKIAKEKKADLKIAELAYSTDFCWQSFFGLEEKSDIFEGKNLNKPINPNGFSNFGAALNELNNKLSDKKLTKLSKEDYLPIFIFMSDGDSTDNYQEALGKLEENPLWKNAIKIAFNFSDNNEPNVLFDIVKNKKNIIQKDDSSFKNLTELPHVDEPKIDDEYFENLIKFIPIEETWLNYKPEKASSKKIVQNNIKYDLADKGAYYNHLEHRTKGLIIPGRDYDEYKLENILNFIKETFGEEVFVSHRFIGYLGDLAPDLKVEKQLLSKINNLGIIKRMVESCEEEKDSDNFILSLIQESKNCFGYDELYNEIIAAYYIDFFCRLLNPARDRACFYEFTQKNRKLIDIIDNYSKKNGINANYNKIIKDFVNNENNAIAYKISYELAERDSSIGLFWLSEIYNPGIGRDHKEKILLKIAADKGNVEAQYKLGYLHYGLKQQYEEEFKYLKLCADNNYKDAQVKVGMMFYKGKGTPVNFEEAFKYFKLNEKDSRSQYYLGLMYRDGKGVEPNLEEALKYLKLSFEQDYSDAAIELGLIYYNGNGVKQDYKEALKYFEAGNANYYLGIMYRNGIGVNKDDEKAFEYFSSNNYYNDYDCRLEAGKMWLCGKAPRQSYMEAKRCFELANNAEANYYLGIMLYYGKGLNQNYEEAFKKFKLSAEENNSNGLLWLGKMYYEGNGTEKDFEQAFKYFKLSAEQDNSFAFYYLGLMYCFGLGIQQNYQEAFNLFKLGADKNNSYAQLALGIMYYKGRGVSQNYQEAFNYCKLSAEQKNPYGLFWLGKLYHDGNVVEQNTNEAFKYFAKSAELDNIDVQIKQESLFLEGREVTDNYEEIFKYYKLWADEGVADGQFYLGKMYYVGRGIAQDYTEAFKYFELSADQNNSDGLLWLGKMYYEGKEPSKDFKEFIVSALKRVVHINYRTAYKYIKRSAKLKNSEAQYMLGKMYRDGKGVIKNKEKAAEYFKLSEEQGNIDAGRALLKLFGADKLFPTLYYYY